jgi:hypothetical protein
MRWWSFECDGAHPRSGVEGQARSLPTEQRGCSPGRWKEVCMC